MWKFTLELDEGRLEEIVSIPECQCSSICFSWCFDYKAAIHCAQYNISEGKVTICHLSQQNATLYKMSSINADFAFSRYCRFLVENPDWNIFFSPGSTSAALAMLSFASVSNTQTQILEVLGFNLTDTPITELHQGFQHLICSLNFPKNELELQMGNAVFNGQQLKPLARVLDDVKTLYETKVFPIAFSNVSTAQQEINSYVEKQTKGKITDLIQDLRLNIIMILVNSIHFKTQWANPFHVSKTEESSSFSVDKTTTVQVLVTHYLEQYYHFLDVKLNCTVLQMDYSENALALSVLPKDGHVEWVEAALSSKTLKRWNYLLQKRWVELFVSKFSISVTYDLGSTLQKMGKRDAFAESANFAGIMRDNGLKLSCAFHKALLHIGKQRIKEVAAPEAVSLEQPEVASLHPIIQFDRTSLMVLEKRARRILFLGKVINPANE
ncbi:hypothetical protein ACRRTK_002141 [Alexandromys fortis]